MPVRLMVCRRAATTTDNPLASPGLHTRQSRPISTISKPGSRESSRATAESDLSETWRLAKPAASNSA